MMSRRFTLASLTVAMAAFFAAPGAHAQTEEWKRPLTDRTFERTPERVARGRYLANGILHCFVCHSQRDTTQAGAPPKAGMVGAGRVWYDEPGLLLVAPNITPDVETGAGGWTDDMLARAIREGVGHDDRPLHPQMYYASFRTLSDADLAAVVAYLRTIEPVRNPLPASQLSPERQDRIKATLRPLTSPVPEPDRSTPEKRGAYLITLADCSGCHTSWHTQRNPGFMGGGNVVEGPASVSTNLTNDPSGVFYDAATFMQVMRTGKGGTLGPAMPWTAFKNLDDADLSAVHAALRKCYPVQHWVNNVSPPTDCAVCGGRHGLGELNHILEPNIVDVDKSILRSYAGTYLNDAYGFSVTITMEGSGLMYSEGGPALRMYPQSETYFLIPGAATPVWFIRGADGKATQLKTHDYEELLFRRVD